MNNPNPFVPRGSLLEKQSQRRSGLKLAVFCVLAVSVTGLVAMLIQGCKREKPSTDTDMNPPSLGSFDTNPPAVMETNPPMLPFSNAPVMLPPSASNPPSVAPVPAPLPLPEPAPLAPTAAPQPGSEYTIQKGDTLAVIAKKNGVSLKALQEANPGVVPTKLKIGQKLVIPAGGSPSSSKLAAPSALGVEGSTTVYTVKSGDTLTRIARSHGTTVKAIQAANGLLTTKIKVGQKLKIPGKAEVAPAVPAPAPVVAPEPMPAPVLPPPTTPAPAPAPGQ